MAIALAAATLVVVLAMHVTVAFIAGMLVYVIGDRLTAWLQRRTGSRHSPALGIAIVIALIAGVVALIVDHATRAAATGSAYQRLVEQMASGLDHFRTTLPPWLALRVPESVDALRTAAVAWLREHATEVRLWSQHTLREITYALAGAIIGLIAVIQTHPARSPGPAPTPWLQALGTRFALFEQSFAAVVFAQLRIATINTALTAAYLLVVLPLLDARLPLTWTLVVLTFVVGLVPIVGNLVTNSVIVVISLTQGPSIAALSLGFLVVVHKLEYLLNAHIVGERIGTKAYELLAVMLLFEAMFGIAGVVMAPIVYAYAKAELRTAGWIRGTGHDPADAAKP